jgi:hypothetical protein
MLDKHIENIMNSIKAGRIDGVIFRPFRFEDIQKTVQNILGTRPYEKNSI